MGAREGGLRIGLLECACVRNVLLMCGLRRVLCLAVVCVVVMRDSCAEACAEWVLWFGVCCFLVFFLPLGVFGCLSLSLCFFFLSWLLVPMNLFFPRKKGRIETK